MKQLVPPENLHIGAGGPPAQLGGRSDDSVLALPAGAERRRFLRWPVFWSAKLYTGERARNCLVVDFSPGGAKVRTPDGPPIGDNVALKFPTAIQLFGKVAWARGGLLGIEFQTGHLPWLRLPDSPRQAMRPVVEGTNLVPFDSAERHELDVPRPGDVDSQPDPEMHRKPRAAAHR